MFTDISISEIENLKNNNINELKILLANKTTSLLHGEEAAKNSEEAAKEAFSGNSLGSNLPTVNISSENIDKKINILDFILFSKLESSKSEIRRLLKGNAIKINNGTVSDEKFVINRNLFNGNYFKLSIGKKRHLKVKIS